MIRRTKAALAAHAEKMARIKVARGVERYVTGPDIRVPNTGVKRGGPGGYRFVQATGGTVTERTALRKEAAE